MTIQDYKNTLGDYAKDMKLNLGSILKDDGTSGLSVTQIMGIALTSAYVSKAKNLSQAILVEAHGILSDAELNAAKSAATIMGMNNIYYRFLHTNKDSEYGTMPAQLRMNVIANPGIEKTDFELYALAASVINGCGMCIEAHIKSVLNDGLTKKAVQTTVRIASVIHGVAQAEFIGSLDEK